MQIQSVHTGCELDLSAKEPIKQSTPDLRGFTRSYFNPVGLFTKPADSFCSYPANRFRFPATGNIVYPGQFCDRGLIFKYKVDQYSGSEIRGANTLPGIASGTACPRLLIKDD